MSSFRPHIFMAHSCKVVWTSIFLFLAMPLYASEVGTLTAPDQSFDLKVETVAKSPAESPALTLNKISSLLVTAVAKAEGPAITFTGLEFNAVMPAHNHGMVVKPKVSDAGPGAFKIEGVKLHMAGDWQLLFSLKANGQTVKLAMPYKL